MTSGDNRNVSWMRADHVAWVGSDARVVVLKLDGQGSTPFALEGTGAAIWHALAPTPQAVDRIVTNLASTYGVPDTSIESDVAAYLMHLRDTGLVIELPGE